jgi:hypothetical protein
MGIITGSAVRRPVTQGHDIEWDLQGSGLVAFSPNRRQLASENGEVQQNATSIPDILSYRFKGTNLAWRNI